MARSPFVSCLVIFFLQLLGACSDARVATRTQLVLVADTDMAELEEVVFDVTPPSGEAKSASGSIAPGAPAYVVMAHESDGPLGPYQVSARGLSAGETRIVRTAEVSFIAGQSRSVLLHLVRSCVDATCDDGLTCGHEGCQESALTRSELPIWAGRPPLLTSGTPGDDAAVEDAGSSGGDASASDDDASAACTPTCEGNSERVCDAQGKLSMPRACKSSDPCAESTCQAGVGCVRQPGNDGAMCGMGLTCKGGVCGADQACTRECSPACSAGVVSCNLDCGATGANCRPNCAPGATCDVACAGTSNCEVSCGGHCHVTCGDASNCVPTCRSGSSCEIDCTDDTNCDKAKCQAGAECLLRCGANESCAFSPCEGGPTTDCGDGVLVCHRSCP